MGDDPPGHEQDMPHGQPGGNQPQPYPTKTLGEIMDALPEMVQEQVMDILNSGAEGSAMVQELRQLLGRFQADLETVGIIPDYLAYMLVYNVLPQIQAQGGGAEEDDF